MEELRNHQSDGINNPVKRKRSRTFRRPRPESQPAYDISSLSFTPPSDDTGKVSCDEIDIIHYASSYPSVNGVANEKPSKRIKKEGVSLDVIYSNTDSKDINHKRSSEGVLAPANWKNTDRMKESAELQPSFMFVNGKKSGEINSTSVESLNGSGNEKVKRVKLKLGGSTRTIDASSNSSNALHSSDKLHDKDQSDDNPATQANKRGGLKGVPWKDFSSGGFIIGKKDSSAGKGPSRIRPGRPVDSVSKSRRAPKKQVTDGAFYDDDDDDDEIRYLAKLKSSRLSSVYRDDEEDSGKKRKQLSNISGNPDDITDTLQQSGKDGKRKSPSEDTDYAEDEEPLSDDETGDKRKTKSKKEPVNSTNEPKRAFALTTRQRALQSGHKDTSASGGSVVEFPNGLPPPPSRKQKEKLTDLELQLKKSEAAQRRKLQNEKAAKESEAEAIRKILGQDSNRKKREEKNKKRREELAQGKAADALLHASNTVRVNMGPNGTIVTFPTEMGLPSLFNSKPVSYPPPREKCAGPSCTNPYKYRDSKTKLPLCSLQCYKAVQALSAI